MINDPTSSLAGADAFVVAAPLLSIATTLLYALIIALAIVILRVRTRSGAMSNSLVRIAMWGGLLTTLLALGFDQHLKFSRSIMLLVRELAYDGGWYADRRLIQIIAIILAFVIASLAGWMLLRKTGKIAPGYRRVTIGAILLVAFVLVRGLSLHHIDAVMAISLADFSVGRMGETAILLAMATGFFSWVRFNAQAA